MNHAPLVTVNDGDCDRDLPLPQCAPPWLTQKRVKEFLALTKDKQHFRASDGKIVSPETIRRAVLQLRSQYFINGTELRLWNTECILNELLEFVKVHYNRSTSPSLYTLESLEKFSSAMVAAGQPLQTALDSAWPNGIINHNGCSGPALIAPSLDVLDGLGLPRAFSFVAPSPFGCFSRSYVLRMAK